MKKILLLSACLLVSAGVFAGKWMKISSESPSKAKISLVSSTIETSTVHFTLGGFGLNQVQTPYGKAFTIELDGTTPLLSKGNPDLPKMTTSLLIPNQAQMKLEIVNALYKDFENIVIAPSKGNLTRDIDPSQVAYNYGNTYSKNAFFPEKITGLNEPYILRDYRGQAISAYPFQYNPVTKVLRVYYDITLRLTKSGKSDVNILPENKVITIVSSEFKKVYNRHFLNFSSAKYTPLEETGSMLIISHGAFMPAVMPLMYWKIAEGIETNIVDVSTIGNAQAIKNYVKNYYAEHGLTYLLLVGDHQQVPSFHENAGYSDNSFSYVNGTDHYPDLFVGRFSGENETHINTQVQKLLKYEINPDTNGDWMQKVIGIGSDQGPGDDNEYDYQHIRGLLTAFDNFTYTGLAEFFDGSQGGLDAPGSPTPAMVGTAINEGYGAIVYCGHGSQNSWGSSGYSSNNINTLTNTDHLPFIFSVACVNGDFTNGTCFAETWLRAKQGENLTGAVATMMSTINQSWNPPMEGQDEMVAILSESYSNNIKRTFAGIAINGCLKMNDSYGGTAGTDMTDTWNVFGDPSMMIRTANAQILTATHNPTVLLGMNQFQVNCPVEGALACITMNNQILGTAKVQQGVANISFGGPLAVIDTLHLVITAFNYIPYITNIQIIAASGPFMSLNAWQVQDPTGNNNHHADFGETISLDMTLTNLGVANADNVNATIATTDPYLTVTDNAEPFGNVNPSALATQNNAYAMNIAAFLPDQHVVPFTVNITDIAGNTWNSSFNLTLNAPKLSAGTLTIDDATGGNGNGSLDPGESVTITIPTPNDGHSDAPNTLGSITSTNSWITISSANCNLNTINAAGSVNATFTITVSPLATLGMPVDITYTAACGPYTVTRTYYIPVGIISEDFETGNFNSYNWQFSPIPWIISSLNPYEGQYCAKSGVIMDNQHSDMMITFDVLSDDSISFYRKVSSEGTYDFLQFFIDSDKKDEWSGELGWQRVVYPVTAGQHTFKWVYIKDYMVASGSDAAWVDFVVFPPVSTTTGIINPAINSAHLQVYPNPSNESATIDYQINQSGNSSLTLFNSLGSKVLDIIPAGKNLAGMYSANLNTRNLTSGVYYIRFENNGLINVTKLVISR